MPSLKEYRNRIASVKSTRKITAAMKMVAASKLRKAQRKAEDSRPYADKMALVLANLSRDIDFADERIPIMQGTGRNDKHLILMLTSDNGLCGGFNNSVIKVARKMIQDLLKNGKEVKVITVGRKGEQFIKREFPRCLLKNYQGFGHKDLTFRDASEISDEVFEMFEREEFDVFGMVYNEFKSVIQQVPTVSKLIPYDIKDLFLEKDYSNLSNESDSLYIFEPSQKEIFKHLLPLNLSLQIFRALLDNSAGEKAARMTAMDSATNNADDMISGLTLKYNRARQSYITNELIEIISGAEAL